MMRSSRPARPILSLLALAVACSCANLGCGGSEDKKVVAVAPEFKQQTNQMLEQMSKDQMEKYKAKAKRR